MNNYIFLDEDNFCYGKVLEGKLVEIFFYDDKDYGSIFRAKVIKKIDYLNGYFLEYKENVTGFLKSKKALNVGESEIVEVVKDKANKKPALLSKNYKIETENLYIKRFSNTIFHKKKGEYFKEKEFLIKIKQKLLNEENFSPTPKLLYKYNAFENYKNSNNKLEIKKISIFYDIAIYSSLKSVFSEKININGSNILINETETLTFIDVNSSSFSRKANKEKIFKEINSKVASCIPYILKLRKIGGMIIIDFLREQDNLYIYDILKKSLDICNLEYKIFGFTAMGLFEFSIKRNSESLKDELKNRNINFIK
ncbi:MAG: ribonuclease E/G [Peptoniphilaceae bacterium]|nr:ribonuclease E/G [Peptoniphilaceae bacterium]MDD7383318.1 ribonuclease E/G [Peptoniphilaceae bacterium]MDY3738311.1 ribonuclease E/G [Peptoniphilaceae bacterium]